MVAPAKPYQLSHKYNVVSSSAEAQLHDPTDGRTVLRPGCDPSELQRQIARDGYGAKIFQSADPTTIQTDQSLKDLSLNLRQRWKDQMLGVVYDCVMDLNGLTESQYLERFDTSEWSEEEKELPHVYGTMYRGTRSMAPTGHQNNSALEEATRLPATIRFEVHNASSPLCRGQRLTLAKGQVQDSAYLVSAVSSVP